MKRFFYFRPEATIGNDDAQGDSFMVAVEDITGMEATGATALDIYFVSQNNVASGHQGQVVTSDKVTLTVTTETQKSVMKALVQSMNAGPHSDGITVVADDVNSTYLVPEITACAGGISTINS